VLPEGYLERIGSAADPRRAGIEAAADLATQCLALDGVVGVNLSGGPGDGDPAAFAEALAETADALGARPQG
jgi:hypothetical protein